MKVSIITVVYNGAEFVRNCIESIINQTYPDIEYIIVDGKSTDGTVDIVQSYGKKVSRFISEPDKGLYDAMNKGIRLATGDVIGLLNADDFYRHNRVIENMVATFQRTGADAVYGDMLYVDRDDTKKLKRYWRSGWYSENAFLWGWMPGHLSFFAKRSLYEQYGLFRLDMKSAADYELMLRFIHKNKVKLAYMDEVTIVMRAGGISNSSVGNRLRANREDRLAWQLNGLKPYFFTFWLKPLRKLKQYVSKPPARPDV
ncbi:glycosyltransferase family 2 protein [Spirosoma endophyticum]|uniref:Glycosyltransferase involved in cell wall bisynthesis n=1 Tax=Spirosoma endophyticum TaxID=662367 RepID=A0A1I2ARL2_9BACT|nr:glycosyltransferase family 2 protein [Spirosoma endophyticum]SFE46486.1 Glycosyltransferase involved in cell wall bisynthesis [Spirosoma endophyticum]